MRSRKSGGQAEPGKRPLEFGIRRRDFNDRLLGDTLNFEIGHKIGCLGDEHRREHHRPGQIHSDGLWELGSLNLLAQD